MDDLLVKARSVLLDALQALADQHPAIVVVGAQAVYLRSGGVIAAIAEATKDADLAVDPRELPRNPLLEEAMKAAGFYRNLTEGKNHPGAWLSREGLPVDLMVPAALSEGASSHRSAWIDPHSRDATRRTVGLEASVVDNDLMSIKALDPEDDRDISARVAGTAALLVAKIHKIHERLGDKKPSRKQDKDAHDIYRLLQSVDDMPGLGANFQRLLANEVSRDVTQRAVEWLPELFADGPSAIGSEMAGRAEEGVGEPEIVAASVAALAADLLDVLR